MSGAKENPRMRRYVDTYHHQTNLTPIFGFRSCRLVTLMEALKHLVNDTNGWKKFIGEAYTKCPVQSDHGLTHEESAAIYLYTIEMDTQNFYVELNKALEDADRKKIIPWFPYLKLLDSALNKLPNVQKCVWRGVKISLINNYHKEQICTWWRITSCSELPTVVEQFTNSSGDSSIFALEVCEGKAISLYSDHPEEKEVVLNMGTTFYVQDNPANYRNLALIHLIDVDKVTPRYPARWRNQAVTVAGRPVEGDRTHQLSKPNGIFVSKDRTVYIADYGNDRIIAWKPKDKSGTIVAGGQGKGDGLNQLNGPRDVAIDPTTNNLLICDQGNQRILVWPLSPSTGPSYVGEIIVNNISCARLTVDSKGSFYVSDSDKHEVRRFERDGDLKGTLVAGGFGPGHGLNQLKQPTHIYVDAALTIFISDVGNDRVMKWRRGASEGIVVAGGNGKGTKWNQLNCPQGVWADGSENVYVVDQYNHRVMLWEKGSIEGKVVVGGNGWGADATQLSHPQGLFFDWTGDLYIGDSGNHRVQRFSIEPCNQ